MKRKFWKTESAMATPRVFYDGEWDIRLHARAVESLLVRLEYKGKISERLCPIVNGEAIVSADWINEVIREWQIKSTESVTITAKIP